MSQKIKNKPGITEQIERGKIFPLVVRLIVPAVIAQLITFLYNVVDRMFVAKIEGSGMDALAALGIVLPVTLILQAFSGLVGLGGSPRAGIKLGEGNRAEANKIFNLSFTMLTVIGILLGAVCFAFARPIVVAFGCPTNTVEFATSYLKIYACGTVFITLAQGLNPFILTQGYSLYAMLSVLCGALLNIVLDPLFIFALDMGVKGSALATVLSQVLSFCVVIWFFFTKRSIFRFRPADMKFCGARMASILSLGVTPFVMTITECAVQIVFNVNLKAATGGNSDYTAALTIMLSALQLISLPLNGMGYGMQPFVSYNYGRGNAARLKQGISCVTVIAFIFAVVVWSLSLAFPVVYARLFSASAAVTEIVKAYAPLFLMGSILFFVQMTLQNVNVALGQAKSALCLAVMRKVVILIPLCFALTHFSGFSGVYLSEGIADFVAGMITSVVIFTTFPKIFRRREEEVKSLAAERETSSGKVDAAPESKTPEGMESVTREAAKDVEEKATDRMKH